jgi:hypothetical protein
VLALSAEECQTAEPQAFSSAVVLIMSVMVGSKNFPPIQKKVLTNPEADDIIKTQSKERN